jgi:hypothetical protein
MNRRLRSPQSVFLSALATGVVAIAIVFPPLLATVPLAAVAVGEKPAATPEKPAAAAGTTAPSKPLRPDLPTFEQVDRNKDGFVDKSESGVVPGLSANFEKADTNKDGKLDKVEFAKALATLDLSK